MDIASLEAKANDIRIDIVSMIAEAKSGHPGGSLSCVEILTALYFGGVLKYDPNDPHMQGRDWFFLSKGHAAPALYATLAHAGFFPTEELSTLRKLGSRLQGHPDSSLLPGIEVSTGSLGQGLSIAAGVAAGLRINDTEGSVFALLGDGECEEGQVWEAAMFAADKNLGNLVAIIDNNDLQIDGRIEDVCNPEDLGDKFCAFGWDVTSVDGHDIASLVNVLNSVKQPEASTGSTRHELSAESASPHEASTDSVPHVVIAKTVKGKGVSFMEDQAGWHGRAPNAEQLSVALDELHGNVKA